MWCWGATMNHERMRASVSGCSKFGRFVVPRALALPALTRGMRVATRIPAGVVALRRVRAGASTLMGAAAALLRARARIGAGRALTDYKAPNYWLDYRLGFVRRGLPGEALRRVVGGSPTYQQVEVTAVGLSRAAALSVVPIALQATRRAPGRLPRVAATALLALSPLSTSLLLHDIGRYDAIGVLSLALLAAARPVWRRLPLPIGVLLLAAVLAVAAATEEFLFAVVAPAAVAAAALLPRAQKLRTDQRLLLLGAVLAPGAAVAGASLLVPAPDPALLWARNEATRAGVGPPDAAMGDALAALGRNFAENLAFFRLFEPTAVVTALALWAALYVVTTALLGRLLGTGSARQYHFLVGLHALVGASLCTVGTDFRRWWGLSLLGLLATLGLSETPPKADERVRLTVVAAVAALALAGLGLRDAPVYPWGELRLEHSLPAAH